MHIISLSSGELSYPPPPCPAELAEWAHTGGGYPPSGGLFELRACLAEHYRPQQADVAPENVLITNGARHALYMILSTTLQPGDEVIVPAPYWFSFPEMIAQARGQLVPLPTEAADNFRIDPARLEALITPRTRVLILTNPGNPTGRIYSAQELDEVVGVLERHPNLHVVVDEVYEMINFTDRPFVHLSDYQHVADRVVTVNGFSKSFAMPGWRVGYIVAAEKLIRQYHRYQEITHAGVSTLAQRMALHAWTHRMGFLEELRTEIRARRDRGLQVLQTLPSLRCAVPEGAFYFFPDVSAYFGLPDHRGRLIRHSVDINRYLFGTQRLQVFCGDIFGDTRHLRISFGADGPQLEEGLQRLTYALGELAAGRVSSDADARFSA